MYQSINLTPLILFYRKPPTNKHMNIFTLQPDALHVSINYDINAFSYIVNTI